MFDDAQVKILFRKNRMKAIIILSLICSNLLVAGNSRSKSIALSLEDEFLMAIKIGDIHNVSEILDQEILNKKIFELHSNSVPLLYCAIASGNKEIVKRIIHEIKKRDSNWIQHFEYIAQEPQLIAKINRPPLFLQWSPDGSLLRINDYTVWDGRKIIDRPGESYIASRKWSKNSRYLYTENSDKSVIIWDVFFNKEIIQPQVKGIRNYIALNSQGTILCGRSENKKTAYIWNLDENVLIDSVIHTNDICFADWNATGEVVCIGSEGGTMSIWDLCGKKLKKAFKGIGWYGESPWSPNRNVLCLGRDGYLVLYNVVTEEEFFFNLSSIFDPIEEVRWNVEGDKLCARSPQRTTWVYDLQKKKNVVEFIQRGKEWALAWHPQGRLVCTGDNEGHIRIFDSLLGTIVAETTVIGDQIDRIQWSADGSLFFTERFGHEVKVWRLADDMILELLHNLLNWTIYWHPIESFLTVIDGSGLKILDDKKESQVVTSCTIKNNGGWNSDGRYLSAGDSEKKLLDLQKKQVSNFLRTKQRPRDLMKVTRPCL